MPHCFNRFGAALPSSVGEIRGSAQTICFCGFCLFISLVLDQSTKMALADCFRPRRALLVGALRVLLLAVALTGCRSAVGLQSHNAGASGAARSLQDRTEIIITNERNERSNKTNVPSALAGRLGAAPAPSNSRAAPSGCPAMATGATPGRRLRLNWGKNAYRYSNNNKIRISEFPASRASGLNDLIRRELFYLPEDSSCEFSWNPKLYKFVDNIQRENRRMSAEEKRNARKMIIKDELPALFLADHGIKRHKRMPQITDTSNVDENGPIQYRFSKYLAENQENRTEYERDAKHQMEYLLDFMDSQPTFTSLELKQAAFDHGSFFVLGTLHSDSFSSRPEVTVDYARRIAHIKDNEKLMFKVPLPDEQIWLMSWVRMMHRAVRNSGYRPEESPEKLVLFPYSEDSWAVYTQNLLNTKIVFTKDELPRLKEKSNTIVQIGLQELERESEVVEDIETEETHSALLPIISTNSKFEILQQFQQLDDETKISLLHQPFINVKTLKEMLDNSKRMEFLKKVNSEIKQLPSPPIIYPQPGSKYGRDRPEYGCAIGDYTVIVDHSKGVEKFCDTVKKLCTMTRSSSKADVQTTPTAEKTFEETIDDSMVATPEEDEDYSAGLLPEYWKVGWAENEKTIGIYNYATGAIVQSPLPTEAKKVSDAGAHARSGAESEKTKTEAQRIVCGAPLAKAVGGRVRPGARDADGRRSALAASSAKGANLSRGQDAENKVRADLGLASAIRRHCVWRSCRRAPPRLSKRKEPTAHPNAKCQAKQRRKPRGWGTNRKSRPRFR
eukprot:GHVT01059659.1.p1 GENE.GHVT01059659.1~~GHVT01059659.1.p1  ORF type:complete len:801 (+),score=80.62 GHVT01059659.1:47-2404(+)